MKSLFIHTFTVAFLLLAATRVTANEKWVLGDGTTVLVNSKQMPLCWVSGDTAVTFEWNNGNDMYQRDMKAYPVGNSYSDCFTRPNPIERYRGVPVSYNTTTLFGKAVPPYLRKTFGQIKTGGTVYRKETNAKDFLTNNPISQWDVSLNESLTKKYGVGFTSMLYKEFVKSQPANANFSNDISNYLNNSQNIKDLRARSGNITYVLVPGLGNDITVAAKGNDVGMKEILDDLNALGLATRAVRTDKFASNLENNVQLIEATLRDVLSKGSDVVIVANSRGVPEALTALSRIKNGLSDGAFPGRVLGFMNMAGLVYGSFLGDWASSNPYVLAAMFAADGWLLKKIAPIVSMRIKAALALSTFNIATYTREFERRLPQDTVYLNLVGTLSGNGLSSDGMLSKMQWIARTYVPHFGANDGYIEYPNTTISKKMASKNYTEVFDSDHLLWTGKYEGTPLLNNVNRRKVIASLLNTMLDRW